MLRITVNYDGRVRIVSWLSDLQVTNVSEPIHNPDSSRTLRRRAGNSI
jgi:hypothetical protein